MDIREKALKFHQEGDLDKAEEIYSDLLEENPNDTKTLNLIGLLCIQSEKFLDAQNYFSKAVEIYPCAYLFMNLGLAYYYDLKFEKAVEYFKKSLEFEQLPEVIQRLALSYYYLDDYPNALSCFLKIYETDSENLDTIRKIAQLCAHMGYVDDAIVFYEKSLRLEPMDYVALNNLGLLHEKKGDTPVAVGFYKKSLKIKPNYEAHHNLGILFRKHKKIEDSIYHFKKAIELDPNNHKAHVSLGMTYLMNKDFQKGYKHYEQRKTREIKETYKNFWDGKKVQNKSILVFCDGGFGDYIMFFRYIPLLKQYFSKVILKVHRNLMNLFKDNIQGVELVLSEQDLDYDYSVSVIDLPYKLNIPFSNIPYSSGYLNVDEEGVSDFRTKYFDNEKIKIGLFWKGNPRVLKNRSMDLKDLEDIFKIEGVAFYSLQKEYGLEQLQDYKNIVDLGAVLTDFQQTAYALKNLDIVITIDSVVAHLAGALGIKTFLMLPYLNEWRWFDDEKKTPWYDSVEIFKQKQEGDWSFVANAISKKLGKSV